MGSGVGYKQGKISAKKSTNAMVFLLIPIFLCCFFPSVALAEKSLTPQQVILTWIDDPTTSQAITWLMSGDLPAQVQYIMADEFNGSFDFAQHLAVFITVIQ